MANVNDFRRLLNKLKRDLNGSSNNMSNLLKKLKQQQQLQEFLKLTGRQPIQSKTPFFNKTLRRFFYDPNKGFYVILGMGKNNKPIIRQMPGLFYYKNVGWRIVPIRPRRR